MELDLTPFLPLLKQLGPWGWIAAAAIWFFQNRRKPAPAPAPLDPIAPAPAPTPGPGEDLLARLRELLKQRFPNLPLGDVADGQHPKLLLARRDELDRQLVRIREDLAQQIQALDTKR